MSRTSGNRSNSLTINYGLRWDQFQAFDAESQLSPRINAVWTPTDSTTIHAGYSRYFSPPPIELIASSTIAPLSGTTAAPPNTTNDTPKAERPIITTSASISSLAKMGDWAGRVRQTVAQPDRRRPVRRADHPDAVQLPHRTPVRRRVHRLLSRRQFRSMIGKSPPIYSFLNPMNHSR